jgi:hypothetical protein
MTWQMEGAELPCETAECNHGVVFDEAAYKANPRINVRQRWPRLYGPCPKGCGFNGIAYASFLHYLAGNW